jgi:hypothetical protein
LHGGQVVAEVGPLGDDQMADAEAEAWHRKVVDAVLVWSLRWTSVSCNVMDSGIGQLPSAAAIQSLWDRAEVLLGPAEFAALIASHRNGTAKVRHRLINQLLTLDDARSGRLSLVAQGAAFVSMAEVDSVLAFAEEWQSSAAWPEVRRGLRAAAEYLHSVGVVAVASMLKVRHPATELVVANAGAREPDLILVVSNGLPVAIEVKAPVALWQPASELDQAAGLRVIRSALASAGTVQGQLRASRPGILALSGLLVGQDTYDMLTECFEMHLKKEGGLMPHLLGLAVFNLRERVVQPDPARVSTLLEQQSTLRRSPAYTGPMIIDDDWSRPWRLVQR